MLDPVCLSVCPPFFGDVPGGRTMQLHPSLCHQQCRSLANQCHTQIFLAWLSSATLRFLVWITSATLRFFSLAKQCHTQIFSCGATLCLTLCVCPSGLRFLVTSLEVVQRNYTHHIVTSNAGAWLSNDTLRYFSLAEQCHTHKFFI